MTVSQTNLDTPIAGLYASPPATLDFAPTMRVRSFLLPRDGGNLQVYAAPSAAPVAEEFGGIARIYAGHWHEAGIGGDRGDAPLFVHAADREAAAAQRSVRAAFSLRHTLDDDLEVIPIPGHTPGSTAYLWDSGDHRLLFTGDTIFLRDGEWAAAVLDSSDRERYAESLELIRELDFDVLVPWLATAGQPYHAITNRRDTRRRVDALLRRLR